MTANSQTAHFTYRPDGLRATRQVGSGAVTRYVYDGQNLVAEKDSAGHVLVSYTNGKSGVISRTTWIVTTSGGTTTNAPDSTIFYLYDGSGNVNAIVDDNGALLKRIDYDVFGAERATGYDSGANNANAESNRMKFSGTVGHVGEPDFGLVYMRARYYDPSLGRFISEDPGRNGPNWYVYGDNNPVNMDDPTGRSADSIAGNILQDVVSYLAAPFAMDLLGVTTILLGQALKCPWLYAAGYVIGIAGGIWTLCSLGALVAHIGNEYVKPMLSLPGGDEALFGATSALKASSAYAVAAYMIEMEYAAAMADNPSAGSDL